MQNLKGTKVYLVGAMDRVADGGIGWRNEITPLLKEVGITIINPCNKPLLSVNENEETRQQIEHYKQTAQYDKIRSEYGAIRKADLRCVDISDFIIAYVDIDVHMCGSYEEIVTANRQKKPILVWCKQGKRFAPNWLFFMLPHDNIFSSMDELISHVHYINDLDDIESLDRWLFFDTANT